MHVIYISILALIPQIIKTDIFGLFKKTNWLLKLKIHWYS